MKEAQPCWSGTPTNPQDGHHNMAGFREITASVHQACPFLVSSLVCWIISYFPLGVEGRKNHYPLVF